jgi:hypothetical protein
LICQGFSIERGLLSFVKTRAVFRPIFLLLREELEEDVLRVIMSSLFSQYLKSKGLIDKLKRTFI